VKITEVPTPDLPCACARWGHDDETCVCVPLERWARAHFDRRPGTPPLSVEARCYMAEDAARVEGQPPAALIMMADDHGISAAWLHALADYCSDKGLL
jgi:hypothetical protein